MGKVVAVSGGFDPLHVGHLIHMQKAAVLGDKLVVILSRDDQLIRKKGYFFMPYDERETIIKAIKGVSEVVKNIDQDSTVTESLRLYKPDIFAKGGDRTPDNMPQSEIDICKEIGCELRYGIGDQLNSSSKLVADLEKKMTRLIYFEPAGQILSSQRYYFENPPEGYKMVAAEGKAGADSHKLLNESLYKFGVASLPWHIIKPKVESYFSKPFEGSYLTFAWNHIIFRNEPWIVHVEWPEMLCGFSKFWFYRLRSIVENKLISNNCKAIITWSNIAAKSFELNYPKYQKFSSKIHIIPLAVPAKVFTKHYDNNFITFISVCSPIPGREDYNFHMKGGKEILEAFKIVNRKYGDKVKLVLVSEIPDNYFSEFSSYPNVRLITRRIPFDEVDKLYKESDVFLFPGHDTPFGVILEAMSYELPVIATDVYGNSELIDNNKTGLIISSSKKVKYFDGNLATRPITGPKKISNDQLKVDWQVVRDLADSMEELIKLPKYRRELGRNARKTIESGIHSIGYRNRLLKEILDGV